MTCSILRLSMQLPKRTLYIVAVIAVVLVSLGLRIYAAQRLDVDYDEPVYLDGGIIYANYMRAGDLKMLAWSEYNFEHPALYKILYGVVLLTHQPITRLPDKDLPRQAPIATAAAGPWNIVDRYLSVFFGTLAVLFLALLDPLAGLLFGVNTLSVKYTSEVYLEALPLLGSLLCVLAYGRWFAEVSSTGGGSRRSIFWLLSSAVFFGITVASKYIYGIVVLAIGLHFLIALLRKQVPARLILDMLGWGLLCVFMFFVFDPYLWPHPLARLQQSILFHEAFQESRLVQMYHYPWWQPLLWLSAFAANYDLHPASAFLVDIDTLIFILAIIGLPALFKRSRLFFYWLAIGLAFLLVWQTKWPQYTVIILAPFSLSAACGLLTLWQFTQKLFARRKPQAASAGTA